MTDNLAVRANPNREFSRRIQRILQYFADYGAATAVVHIHPTSVTISADGDNRTIDLPDGVFPITLFDAIIRHPSPVHMPARAVCHTSDGKPLDYALPTTDTSLPHDSDSVPGYAVHSSLSEHLKPITFVNDEGESRTHCVFDYPNHFTFDHTPEASPGSKVHHTTAAFIVTPQCDDVPETPSAVTIAAVYVAAQQLFHSIMAEHLRQHGGSAWLSPPTARLIRRINRYMADPSRRDDLNASWEPFSHPPSLSYYQDHPTHQYGLYVTPENAVQLDVETVQRPMVVSAVDDHPQLDVRYVQSDDPNVPRLTLAGIVVTALDGTKNYFHNRAPYSPHNANRVALVQAIDLDIHVNYPSTGKREQHRIPSDHYVWADASKYVLLATEKARANPRPLTEAAMSIRSLILPDIRREFTETTRGEWAASLAAGHLLYPYPENPVQEILRKIANTASTLDFSNLGLARQATIEATSDDGSITVVLNT